jgi:hypothetical protein
MDDSEQGTSDIVSAYARRAVRRASCYVAIPAVLAVAGIQSCTLVSDFDVRQCESDADCRSLDGNELRCERARCVSRCNTNRECAALDPRYPICMASNGLCTALTSSEDECYAATAYDDELMGGLSAADLTILGAFSAAVQSSTWLSLELAVDEINAFSKVSGVYGPPIVGILCSGAQESVPSALEHLVDNLGSRTMVASLEDDALRVVVASPRSSRHSLFLSPHSVAVDGEAQRQGGSALWYLGGLQQAAVKAYPALVRRGLEAAGQAESENVAIVALVGPTAEDTALANAVEAIIDVNGLGVSQLKAFDRYRRIALNDDSAEDRARVMQEVVAYAPRLIWTFLGGKFSSPSDLERSSFVVSLDAALAATMTQSPLYILGPRSADDSALRAWASTTPSFRSRSVIIDADRPIDDAVLGSATERFTRAFPKVDADASLHLAGGVYDAVYLLAYAASYAATISQGQQSIDDLVAGLEHVTAAGGATVIVGPGPAGLDVAVPALVQGVSIDVVGTTGPASFDPTQRARPASTRLRCWSDTSELREIGVFDDAGGDFEIGVVPCAQSIFGEP